MKRFKYTTVVLLNLYMLLHFYSCSKNESVVNFDSYVSDNLATYGSLPLNVDTIIMNMDIKYARPSSAMPVLLKEAQSQDLLVSGKIDYRPEIITSFNKMYRTNMPLLQPDLFKVSNTVTIKKGEKQSKDSIYIQVDKYAGLAEGYHDFIVPVALTSQNNDAFESELLFFQYRLFVVNNVVSMISSQQTDSLSLGPAVGEKAALYLKQSIALKDPLEVALKIESSDTFVANFNSTHGTAYQVIPQGSFKTLTNSMIINPKEKETSIAPIIEMINVNQLIPGKFYLMAISINQANNSGVHIDPQNNTVFVIVSGGNIDNSDTNLVGNSIDRTKWFAAASNIMNANTFPEKVLDGNNGTAWVSSLRQPQFVQVDMKTSYLVKGIKFVPNYLIPTNDAIEAMIMSSTDGINYISQGVYKGTAALPGSSAENPDMKVIKFIKPVNARYLRIVITKSTSTTASGIGEIYVFQ